VTIESTELSAISFIAAMQSLLISSIYCPLYFPM
jgi:hypothetical protein